jgi:hypothetical protein
VNVIQLGEQACARFIFQPGWVWSKDVSPIAGTASCHHRHLGYTISGSLHVRMDDGVEMTIGPGDVYEIPPGHDAWVVGDDPWDSIEFASARSYGAAPDVRVRRAIDQYIGREMATLGDGFLALFDGPARAVRAAIRMSEAVADLGLKIRIGIHTGEIEIDGGQARGVAVHMAARVAAIAGGGQILVSSMTHDLLDGSGLEFDVHGHHELKGFSGARTIFLLKR